MPWYYLSYHWLPLKNVAILHRELFHRELFTVNTKITKEITIIISLLEIPYKSYNISY